MVHLRNLNSSECFSGVNPWRFINLSLVPAGAFKDKALRDGWVNNPSLSFNVYTLYEGTQSNLRLRSAQAGADENPPLLMHGLAIDYDTAMTVQDVIKALPMMGDVPPNWFEQTLSGNGRLVWMFERPLRIPSRKFLLRVIAQLHDVIPFRKLPMIDESALKAPERYFTNGCRWTQISRRKVPYALIYGSVLRISEKFDWQQKEFGKAVNLVDIAEECKRVFPRFADWPGEFTVGATGPTFWVDGSTSPKSAIVRDTGMQTFSAHATKAFYSWAEIVGAKFVETNEANRLGKAVESIWWDGRSFISKDATGKFAIHNKDNMRMLLQGKRGLKGGAAKGGGLNEVDQALVHVLDHQSVEAAASCAYYPHGVFTYSGRRILNMHQLETVQPAPESCGMERFPFLANFLKKFFAPSEPQLAHFLSWLQYAYKSAYERQPVSGHALFIAGPVGCGKTFMSRGVIGGLFGGYGEANAYLAGTDGFNSELFQFFIWVIDDGSIMTSDKGHQLYSENVKRCVANQDHRVNEKFRPAGMIPWQGRVVNTLNDDVSSLRQVPNMDASLMEKLIILKCGPRAIEFLRQPEMEAMLRQELPYFARWLLDWAPPAYCFEGASVRFGVSEYANPEIVRAANLSSGKSVFVELVARWLTDFFKSDPSAREWVGTATELRMAMSTDVVYSELLRSYRPETFPRMLVEAMNKKVLDISVSDEGTTRTFTIRRDESFGKARPAPAPVAQTENSSFQK